MSQDEVARRLSAVGAKVRRGKLGSVLAVDFSKKIATDVTGELPPESLGVGAELPPWIQDLGECVKCRELVLAGQPIGNSEVQYLFAHLPSLQVVDLDRTSVTDVILDLAESMEKLKILSVSGTNITSDRVQVARKRLIKTRIVQLD
ncbi:MAG: hypothetical protein VYC98_19835 [Planctomycetota bacterium]|nr:hypothetical protein [Planctomycetota bacterium]